MKKLILGMALFVAGCFGQATTSQWSGTGFVTDGNVVVDNGQQQQEINILQEYITRLVAFNDKQGKTITDDNSTINTIALLMILEFCLLITVFAFNFFHLAQRDGKEKLIQSLESGYISQINILNGTIYQQGKTIMALEDMLETDED